MDHTISPANSESDDKDTLSQQDIKEKDKDIDKDQPGKALETADGKNNGAEPAVFKNERKYRT